jgi:cytoskeletal protein RodZ
MKEIGKILKERREHKKITLAQAHAATKIQEKHLIALEEGNGKVFSAQVYYKSFLKSYAKYLGIDQEELLKRYDESNSSHDARQRYDYEHNGEFFVKEIYEDKNEEDEKEEFNIKKIETKHIIAALAVLVVLTAVFFYLSWPDMQDLNDTKTNVKSVQAEQSDVSVSSQTAPDSVENFTDFEAQKDIPLELRIEAVENVWVKIDSDGKEQFQGTLLRKSSKGFKADKEFYLRIGYTPGIKVFFNGEPIDVISGSVQDVNSVKLQRENK